MLQSLRSNLNRIPLPTSRGPHHWDGPDCECRKTGSLFHPVTIWDSGRRRNQAGPAGKYRLRTGPHKFFPETRSHREPSTESKRRRVRISDRSEEHTSELQSHSFISYAV